MNVLNLEHISKIYGDKVIFDDISCGIHQGDKIGIIGINGTGKTTFLLDESASADGLDMKDQPVRMACVSVFFLSIRLSRKGLRFFPM